MNLANASEWPGISEEDRGKAKIRSNSMPTRFPMQGQQNYSQKVLEVDNDASYRGLDVEFV